MVGVPVSRRGALAVLLAGAGGACGRRGGSAGGARDVRVAAAASLASSFDALAPLLLAQTGQRLAATYAATAVLLRQIAQGAPYDLFAVADAALLAPLERDDALAPGTRRTFARGRVVLYVPTHALGEVRALEDLRKPSVRRIAYAAPAVAPYGRAAVEALRSVGLWSEVQARMLAAPDVRGAYQYALSGNTDAAFTARSVPPASAPGRVVLVDASLHAPVEQAVAVTRAAPNPEGARAFLRILASGEGRAALASHGLDPL